MKYEKVIPAVFISRPNRFVAQVMAGGEEITVHVKNTGRCRELLVPGAKVYLEDFTYRSGKRKLLYDLIAVEKGDLLINMDSQAPNKVVKESLENGRIKLPFISEIASVRPETVYGSSRVDFYVEDNDRKRCFIEVKGVTLERDGIAAFPDAPTERGVKHIRELMKAAEEGYIACILFVVQMNGMKMVVPNNETHREFGDALREAAEKGVHILAYECDVAPDRLDIVGKVDVCLDEKNFFQTLDKSVKR